MAINPDFRDLFAALSAAEVAYMIVGGYALAYHGFPRFTKDLDVWIDATPENSAKAYRALDEFGAPISRLAPDDLAKPGLILQIGVAPNRIDILTSIEGVAFAEAWPRREALTYGDQILAVIGRQDLIRNKRATGRPQDSLDADVLEDKKPKG